MIAYDFHYLVQESLRCVQSDKSADKAKGTYNKRKIWAKRFCLAGQFL
jgi:hypothetical protein